MSSIYPYSYVQPGSLCSVAVWGEIHYTGLSAVPDLNLHSNILSQSVHVLDMHYYYVAIKIPYIVESCKHAQLELFLPHSWLTKIYAGHQIGKQNI